MRLAGARSNHHPILVSTLIVAALSILLKALGYGEKRLLAYGFGAEDSLDVYFCALKVSSVAYFGVRGILRPVVVPLLTSAKNRSPLEGRAFGFSVACGIGLALVFFSILALLWTPELLHFFAPGFSPAKRELCIGLTRLMVPVSLFFGLSQLMTLSLQVRKRFGLASLAECLQKGIFMFFLVTLVFPLGFGWIAVAYWVAALATFAFLLACHAPYLLPFSDLRIRPSYLSQLGSLAWPLAIGSAISQLGRLFQNRFASTLDSGSISALAFAQALVDLPLLIAPFALSLVLLPYLSEYADKSQAKQSEEYLFSSVRILLMIFLPLGLVMLFLRRDIVSILFAGGAFSQSSTALTAAVLSGMSVGTPIFAVEIILSIFFFARKQIMIPVVCGIVGNAAGIALLPILTKHFHLSGVGFFLVVTRSVKVICMTILLRRIGVVLPWQRAMLFLLRASCLLLFPILFYILIIELVPVFSISDGFLPKVLGRLSGAAAVICLCYTLGALYCTSAEERKFIGLHLPVFFGRRFGVGR